MISKRNIWLYLCSFAFVAAIFISACNKENSTSTTIPAGKQQVIVSLNDDPVPNLSSVIVDVRYVEVKVDTGKEHHEDGYYDEDHEGDENHHEGDEQNQEDEHNHHGGDHFGKWDTLSVTPGLYDLLKLKNGTDTLIANGFSNLGKITKIRITLGTNNSVSTDSTHTYPLPTCSGSPYVYLKVKSTSIDSLSANQYMIRIDFDVARSIHFDDGQYCLKPILKSYSKKTSGSVEGIVLPREALATVIVLNNSDTAFAIPEEDGEFKVRGLNAGVYSVIYNATAPYKDTTLLNIQVQNGIESKLPVITLHQ